MRDWNRFEEGEKTYCQSDSYPEPSPLGSYNPRIPKTFSRPCTNTERAALLLPCGITFSFLRGPQTFGVKEADPNRLEVAVIINDSMNLRPFGVSIASNIANGVPYERILRFIGKPVEYLQSVGRTVDSHNHLEFSSRLYARWQSSCRFSQLF